MAQGYTKIVVIGNVGSEPSLRYTPSGVAVCDFSLAVNKTRGKGEDKTTETTWLKISVWRERAETANTWIKKGALLLVEGDTIKASAYVGKDGKPAASLELTANDFKFLDSKPQDSGNQQQSSDDEYSTDQIPF